MVDVFENEVKAENKLTVLKLKVFKVLAVSFLTTNERMKSC